MRASYRPRFVKVSIHLRTIFRLYRHRHVHVWSAPSWIPHLPRRYSMPNIRGHPAHAATAAPPRQHPCFNNIQLPHQYLVFTTHPPSAESKDNAPPPTAGQFFCAEASIDCAIGRKTNNDDDLSAQQRFLTLPLQMPPLQMPECQQIHSF